MRNFISSLIAATALAQDVKNHWAIIVAGSNGYWNYRHQADAHHAWNVITKNGIPESNVILFAYDDIANNLNNPLPGTVYNSPNGENVYNKAAIDYSGVDVTPENFLAALTGDPTTGGNGKVLQSDEESKVFVFFTDHGAPGLIAFPSSYLYADDLNKAVEKMSAKGMYKQLIFYIEACESGSMFPELANNIGVAAMTASNGTESSWATYCDPDDVVGDVHIGSCLGDLFSVNWMEDTEAHDPASETLLEQYKTVKKLTTESPVQLFGELDFGNEYVGDFQGTDEGAA
jgi:legumain